jgi:hypothetical protein
MVVKLWSYWIIKNGNYFILRTNTILFFVAVREELAGRIFVRVRINITNMA